jgi:hypothetical protein
MAESGEAPARRFGAVGCSWWSDAVEQALQERGTPIHCYDTLVPVPRGNEDPSLVRPTVILGISIPDAEAAFAEIEQALADHDVRYEYLAYM